MNDFYESVHIEVFGENRINVSYVLMPESCEEGEEKAEILRICELTSIAMGRELARTFRPDVAENIAFHYAKWMVEEIRRAKKNEKN